jgi:hypothetical protein
MSQPTNREELKAWCLRKIGAGAVQINVTDEQLEDRIDESLDLFNNYHFDGTMLTYLTMQANANVISNQYFLLPNNVIGVDNIFRLDMNTVNSEGNGQANFNMFDLSYQIRLNELYDFTSADYQYFTMANQHIETLALLFIGDTLCRYNRYNNILYTDWNWSSVTPGMYIVIECYTIVEGAYWSDYFLKKYTAALFKEQFAQNLSKYGGVQLPGGVTIDADKMMHEAIEERDKVRQELDDRYQSPARWMIG